MSDKSSLPILPPPQQRPPRKKIVTPPRDSVAYNHMFRPGQRNANGAVICGANDHGAPCQTVLVDAENGRCVKHGGASARGLAHPNYRTGEYQQSGRYGNIPAKMLTKLVDSLDDPEYLSNKDEIAVVTALIDEQLALLELANGDEVAEKHIYRELKKLIALRQTLTAAQLKTEAYVSAYIPYAEVVMLSERIQHIIRDLAFDHFKDKARPFLTELQAKLNEVIFE